MLNETLETAVEIPSKKKIAAVDTCANITYSWLGGAAIDFASGLSSVGVLVARASSTPVNALTGGLYGWYREKVNKLFRVNEKKSRLRSAGAELFAFNTFQVPAYAISNSLGRAGELAYNYLKDNEKHVEWMGVLKGCSVLAMLSPFVGPTLGWYTDKCRRLFRIKPASEGAYKHRDS